jgi:hypothetical protein
MLSHIRLATEAEIETIKDQSDILPGHTTVLEHEGSFAVIRNPVEVNPCIWPKDINDVKKARFIYSLEERLLGAGIDRYYSQIAVEDERWQKVIENWGFQRVSPVAEYRYLRLIK